MAITVRECKYDEVAKFRQLEGEYHYMGESHGAGDTIRLIFEEDGRWIALMTWAAACYRLKPRDQEIGWNRAMCAKRLKLIANNRRFTILDKKGARPNLASQILGMAMRELPAIWKAKWGYSPLLAETFCDIEQTAGTCYRAAGWRAVGKTRGFSRIGHSRDFFIKNDRPKVLFMKGFTKDAWETIVANDLPDEYDVAAHSKADGVLPCSVAQVESLQWEFCQVKDPRKGNRSIGIGTILTLFTMGVAAGAHDLKAVHAFAASLTNEQLKLVGCTWKRDKFGNPIEGQYACPSYSTFHYLLAHKDKAGRNDFDVADFAAHLSKWMTAQEGKLSRHLTIDGKFVREIIGLVSLVDAESGDVVAVAPASKKEGLKGRCELPVSQEILAGQDLSGAVVSGDALNTQDDTARIILERGGDYVLQVKKNRKKVLSQSEKISHIRPLVGTVKKKELNRGRWEERETKVYLVGDPVDADFPGATMVVRTFRQTWKVVWRGKYDRQGQKILEKTGKPTKEVAWHVTSLAPKDLGCEGDACAEKLAGYVRAHWYVEVYHGERDNGYHEDKLTRRMNTTIMSAMMVARSFGMWICARSPGKSTEAVQKELFRHPSKLLRIIMKGGRQ